MLMNAPFKGVFILEDLTTKRSKLFRFIKDNTNVERIRTTEGKIQVYLKTRGLEKNNNMYLH